jgi:hypothetical protein
MPLTPHVAIDQLLLQDRPHTIGTIAAHADQTNTAAWEALDCRHPDLFLQTSSDDIALVH